MARRGSPRSWAARAWSRIWSTEGGAAVRGGLGGVAGRAGRRDRGALRRRGAAGAPAGGRGLGVGGERAEGVVDLRVEGRTVARLEGGLGPGEGPVGVGGAGRISDRRVRRP